MIPEHILILFINVTLAIPAAEYILSLFYNVKDLLHVYINSVLSPQATFGGGLYLV